MDGETLVMADRAGVEIDYCPKCRGVWLDRGELDKIIERAALQLAPQFAPQPASQPAAATPVYQPDTSRGYAQSQRRDADDDHRQGRSYKKRESFLGELFDF
jgi:Zn-finger nucleic acid-binding protein